jgi:hypothetical protein
VNLDSLIGYIDGAFLIIDNLCKGDGSHPFFPVIKSLFLNFIFIAPSLNRKAACLLLANLLYLFILGFLCNFCHKLSL